MREVPRGEDFFRSAVIEALGDYKAHVRLRRRHRRRQARWSAAGRCGAGAREDRRQARARDAGGAAAHRAESRAAVDRRGDLPARRQLRVARELSGRDAEVRGQEPRIPGAAARAPRRGLGALAVAGHAEAAQALFEVGMPSQDPTRAPVALALGTVALRNTPLMLACSRQRAIATPRSRSRRGFRHARGRSRQGAVLRAPSRPRLLGCAPTGSPARGRLLQTLDRQAGFLSAAPRRWITKQSGVDIDAGNETVRRIRSLARGTFTPGVLSDIGSFGGLFTLDRQRYRGAGARLERRRRRHEAEGGVHDRPPRHGRRRSRQPLRQRHPRAGRASRCSFSTISRRGGCRRTSPSRSSPAWRGRAARTAAR